MLAERGDLCHVPHCDGRCGWDRAESAGCDGRWRHFATSTQHWLAWRLCSQICNCIGSVVMKYNEQFLSSNYFFTSLVHLTSFVSFSGLLSAPLI